MSIATLVRAQNVVEAPGEAGGREGKPGGERQHRADVACRDRAQEPYGTGEEEGGIDRVRHLHAKAHPGALGLDGELADAG
jgi:hypothetical protein